MLLELHNFPPLKKMVKLSRRNYHDCEKIERLLAQIGVVQVEGSGFNRRIKLRDDSSDKANKLISHFCNKTGKRFFNKSYKSQYQVAEELVREFGLEASKWMIDYIIDVEKMDMYSLRLVYSFATNLLPKYEKWQAAQQRFRQESSEDYWDLDNVPKHERKVRESLDESEIGDLMSFGIKLED